MIVAADADFSLLAAVLVRPPPPVAAVFFSRFENQVLLCTNIGKNLSLPAGPIACQSPQLLGGDVAADPRFLIGVRFIDLEEAFVDVGGIAVAVQVERDEFDAHPGRGLSPFDAGAKLKLATWS